MTLALQQEVVYGPMTSRRFGRSLGINLLSGHQKLCSFDCVYCQYGETPFAPAPYPTLEDIRHQTDQAFARHHATDQRPDWIMIAGNGEPTLHPQLNDAITEIIRSRDRHLRGVPIGILSNSATCHRSDVRDALSRLEGRFMKLDAGEPGIFHRVNRPASSEAWRRLISGLYQMHPIVLQSLFVTGMADNSTDEAVFHWISAVGYIRPESVQIYTLDRAPAVEGVKAVSWPRLREIADRLREKTGIAAQAYPPSRPNEDQV